MSPREVTEFSRAFSRHLDDMVKESPKKISQKAIADALPGGRVQSYVNDRLNGKKPVDTDMIDVIATMLGWSPAVLVGQVLGRMGRASETLISPMMGMENLQAREDQAHR